MNKNRSNKRAAFASGALLAFLLASQLYAQTIKTNTPANARDVIVGAFTVKVPNEWRSFSASESDNLRRQYISQIKKINRRYSGGQKRAKLVDFTAFQIESYSGTFAIVSFDIPSQTNLIKRLIKRIEINAKWGIQQGNIQKYLGLVPLNYKQFSGFYAKFIGHGGRVQISAGLEHRKLKNTLLQLKLICPKEWNEVKAIKTLSVILKSAVLS